MVVLPKRKVQLAMKMGRTSKLMAALAVLVQRVKSPWERLCIMSTGKLLHAEYLWQKHPFVYSQKRRPGTARLEEQELRELAERCLNMTTVVSYSKRCIGVGCDARGDNPVAGASAWVTHDWVHLYACASCWELAMEEFVFTEHGPEQWVGWRTQQLPAVQRHTLLMEWQKAEVEDFARALVRAG